MCASVWESQDARGAIPALDPLTQRLTLTPVDTTCVRAGVTADTPDVSGRDPAAQMEAEGRRGRRRGRRRGSDSEAAGQSVPSVGMKLRGPGSSGNAEVAAWSSQHSSRKKDGAMVDCGDTQTAEKRCVQSWDSWDHVITLHSQRSLSRLIAPLRARGFNRCEVRKCGVSS